MEYPRHRLSYPCNGQPLKAQTKIQQKNRAQARFFYILRTVLDNSAQTVYNYDSTDLRSVTVSADSGTSWKAVVYIKNKWTKVISMWVLIYAFLGFLYFLASTWKPIFSTIGIEAMFPIYTFINIFASFCIYFYHDFRKEPCKNKWYKFVLGNLLTVVLFVGLFFVHAAFALHDM